MPARRQRALDAHEVFLLDFGVACRSAARATRPSCVKTMRPVESMSSRPAGREPAQVARLERDRRAVFGPAVFRTDQHARRLVAVLGLARDVADRLVEEDRDLLALVLARRRIDLDARRRGGTRVPSVFTTTPSTFTQPFSIHSSASRREQSRAPLIRLTAADCPFAALPAQPGRGRRQVTERVRIRLHDGLRPVMRATLPRRRRLRGAARAALRRKLEVSLLSPVSLHSAASGHTSPSYVGRPFVDPHRSA